MTDRSTDADVQFNPPAPYRVAARALILAVTSCRGFIEPDAAVAGDFWRRVRNWFCNLDISGELEPAERALIETPLGSLDQQDSINAAWSCKGMTISAWALGRFAMPPYDKSIVAADVADTLVAQNPWFGTMPLDACRLLDGDLAIGPVRIDKTDPAASSNA